MDVTAKLHTGNAGHSKTKTTNRKHKTMKTQRHTIAALAIAATALISGTSEAANRTLILLQENSAKKTHLDGTISGALKFAIDNIVNSIVSGSQSAKFQGVANGSYQRFINLSDTNATRERLLAELIRQSKDGFTSDLAILNNGSRDLLTMRGGQLTGSPSFATTRADHIRNLLSQARVIERNPNFQFKLRLVQMNSATSSSLSDDWTAIGAKATVGLVRRNWMPEPLNHKFWSEFVKNEASVADAATRAIADARNLWRFVPGYDIVDPAIGLSKLSETQLSVTGDRGLIFKDEFQLGLNQSRSFTVRGNRTHNFPGIFMVAGQQYRYRTNGTWKSTTFAPAVNANGHAPGAFDGGRRHRPSNMMALIGERFGRNNNLLTFVPNSAFRIGASNTLTASGSGFINLYANDGLLGYGDNSGTMTVTITRTR